MGVNKMQAETESIHKKQIEDTINRWYFLLENGRHELQLGRWQEAVLNYRSAYTEAELLVFISGCKNCAVKNYMRTLVEYCYALCKIDSSEQLSDLTAHAWYTLNTCVTEALTLKLLQPLRAMESSSDDERDLWMNQLFAEEAVHLNKVH